MLKIEKTVFISYRRTNIFHARAIYQDLRANGYDVFLDYENIDSGAFHHHPHAQRVGMVYRPQQLVTARN